MEVYGCGAQQSTMEMVDGPQSTAMRMRQVEKSKGRKDVKVMSHNL